MSNWVETNVLACNTHVGEAVDAGWANQVHNMQPQILLLSEISNERVWARLRELVGDMYWINPTNDGPWVNNREWFQHPVLMHRGRYGRPVKEWNGLVSAWRGGGDHGRLWPTRFRTAVKAFDNRTRRMTFARSVHTWALGPNPPPGVLHEHRKQVDDVADWCEGRTNPAAVVFAGGDWNENLNDPNCYVRRAMRGANMSLAGRDYHRRTSKHGDAWLDGVFTREKQFITRDGFDVLENRGSGDDHFMALAKYSIRVREVQS
jgi:hypothetical protein